MLTLNKLCLLRPSFTCTVRYKSKSQKNKRFTDTLNLPKSDFPQTVQDEAATKREQHIFKVCGFSKLYDWQWSQKHEKKFVLHDGPPYANGKPHVGHALNKILKDIINRYKVMRGYRVHYMPGWDCHGLPIELKAIKNQQNYQKMSPLEIRSKAKKYAEDSIEIQKAAFQRWGVMADWDTKCYFTFDPSYEVNQTEVFFQLFEKHFVYRDIMPVYWSPSSRTALAESELEYNENHVSPSVYVRFPVSQQSACLQNHPAVMGKPVYAVTWTTTPWTLPANQAICYNNDISYCVVEESRDKNIYICGKIFLDKLCSILKRPVTPISEFTGNNFEGMKYIHPLYDEEMPFLPADHVIEDKGTGFVHTAPSHGHDDFLVALKHNIKMKNMVNGDGSYTEEAGHALQGKTVGIDAENAVIDLLGDHMLHKEDFTHKYPYDWRTKLPVIIRASKQWFINTNQIKEIALECMREVTIYPQSSEKGMISQLESRPYWCVSRQRVWGLPIPVFYHRPTGEPLINRQTIDHIQRLIAEHGSDCWWTMSEKQLIPNKLLKDMNMSADDFVKGEDILDIWFDSGSTWMLLQNENIEKADVYLEGLDQFGGWFQSSLLTSAALRKRAPYQQLLVHGFTMDEQGQKMSKSIGNVVDPEIVISGGKDRNKDPSFGADVLRWWVAHSNFNPHVLIGQTVLQNTNEEIFKIRKVLRHLLGNLSDFNVDELLPYEELLPQDQYMLYLLYQFAQQITTSYDEYKIGKVQNNLKSFVNTQISGLYFTITKDRLYCSNRTDHGRLSSQTVMYHILCVLTKAMAPIIPFIAEEIFQYTPKTTQDKDSIFKCRWFQLDPAWNNLTICDIMAPVLSIRHQINTCVEIDQPVQYEILIYCSNLLYNNFKLLQDEDSSCNSPLNELLQVSYTHLTTTLTSVPDDTKEIHGSCTVSMKDGKKSMENYMLVIFPALKHICERCRRYTAEKSGIPCNRCVAAMATDWA